MQIKKLYPFYCFLFLLIFFCRNHIFFWDTYQLGAKQAWTLFENGLLNWRLPPEIDSGHPPIFGMYLAAFWRLFSPSLWVSHFAMLPFLIGVILYTFKIGCHLLDPTKAIYLILLLLADAIFIGQAILISPDVVLVFFFMMAIYAVFTDASNLKIIAAIGLGLISMRGMMTLGAIILFDLWKDWKFSDFKKQLGKLFVYVPAIVTILFFLVLHYINTGWVGYHEESEWASAFKRVGFMGFLKNIGIYIWRLIDYGRIIIWIVLIAAIYKNSNFSKDKNLKALFLLAGFTEILIAPVLIMHEGLLAHRYLLPITISLTILMWYAVFTAEFIKSQKNLIFTIVITIMLIGNFLVYPRNIAQGWDSTFAHIPYYSLRKKMIEYIDSKGIEKSAIGTSFPNIGPLKYYDPELEGNGFPEMDFDAQDYIFYSNVYNDFTDQQLEDLKANWEVEKCFGSLTVDVCLYKKIK